MILNLHHLLSFLTLLVIKTNNTLFCSHVINTLSLANSLASHFTWYLLAKSDFHWLRANIADDQRWDCWPPCRTNNQLFPHRTQLSVLHFGWNCTSFPWAARVTWLLVFHYSYRTSTVDGHFSKKQVIYKISRLYGSLISKFYCINFFSTITLILQKNFQEKLSLSTTTLHKDQKLKDRNFVILSLFHVCQHSTTM